MILNTANNARTLFLTLVFLTTVTRVLAQPPLSYYLGDSVTYDKNIPTPASIIGHEVGEFHVSHDKLVTYMQALASASERISLEVIGYTYEKRPLLILTITSPENHSRLEDIRREHVQLTDPETSASLNTARMPAVFYMGFSIHGNEPSGSNAALIMAYHLAAAQGAEVENQLRNTVILLDPSFNPDGLQRFASWVNSRKSNLISADPYDMEHNEPWPGGRTNHYWFDLNRDWLVAQQPESQARIRKFHEWKPNVLTDHHEMGSSQTFFFQPGVPSRTHPLTPARNIELTKKMGEFHARAFDRIGSLYYTQEDYDDFYYGKGSTFPDIQGAMGILFEQASSRGHAQRTENGLLTFPFTIRNQLTAAMSSLQFVEAYRQELLDYQRDFFREAATESKKDPVKALIFGSAHDKGRVFHLAEILTRHNIRLYRPAADQTINGKTYRVESSYVIPLNQPQYRLIKSMFETRTQFPDSLFYDISSWTLSLAAGADLAELRSMPRLGEAVTTATLPKGQFVGKRNSYAYAIEPFGFYTPRALYRLLDASIKVKVATQEFFHPGGKAFPPGSLVIALNDQDVDIEDINDIVDQIMEADGIDVHSFETGLDYRGTSLGSGSFRPVRKPRIAILVGDGVTSYDAGEIWHLLDTRFSLPVTMLPVQSLQRIDLARYNTIIFPQGNYSSIPESAQERLKTWVNQGGVIVGFENALSWLTRTGLGQFRMKRNNRKNDESPVASRPYSEMKNARGAQATNGAIFEAEADLTHPLLYGYSSSRLPVFKGNNLFMEPSSNPYANPLRFTERPLLSGYISRENYAQMPGASIVGVTSAGSGRVIGFTENVAFRAFWFGTNRLLMNSIFFGPIIASGSSR